MGRYLNWSKILLGLLYVFIFIMGFTLSYESLKLSKIFVKKDSTVSPTPNAYILASPKPIEEIEPVKQEKGTYNILLLGYGGAGHSGGALTDSIILIHVDLNSHKITFISIPRDLWVSGNHKINSSGISGFSQTSPVVTSVTGIPVNYFVAVDFSGFSKIINYLGGINVNTPVTFDDPFYPIAGQENNTCGKSEAEINALKAKYSGYSLETQFTCRYERLHYDKGSATLSGTEALKYVRSRHGDSDFGRSARQFAVLQGIAGKLISLKAVGQFDNIVNAISTTVKTDLDAGTIKSLISIMGDAGSYTYNKIQLTTENVLASSTSTDGQFILIPKAGNLNFTEIKNFIKSGL